MRIVSLFHIVTDDAICQFSPNLVAIRYLQDDVWETATFSKLSSLYPMYIAAFNACSY